MKKFLVSVCVLLAAFPAIVCAMGDDKVTIENFDRGISMEKMIHSCFIPKGTLGVGLTLSYSNYSIGNMANDAGYKVLLGLIDDISGGLHTFGISPRAEYFFLNNISAGIRFDYDRTGLNIGNASLSLGDGLSFGVSDRTFLKNMYSGSVFLRDYLPIGNSKRFAIFAELNIGGAGGQSESYTTQETEFGTKKVGTYSRITKFSIGVNPGLICFVTNEAAVEVALGVLGYNWQKTVQTTNQVEVSQMRNSNGSFKINLLTIKIGMSFYLPLLKWVNKK